MWYAEMKRLNERDKCNGEEKIRSHVTKENKANRVVYRKNS